MRRSSAGCLILTLLTGCAAPRARDGFVVARGEHFEYTAADGRQEIFGPWGFNYDRTTLDGHDVLLEDVLRRRPQKIDADFAAMRALGGNTVRVFLATAWLLDGPRTVNARALRQLDVLLAAAERHGLRLIVVGLANIRPAAAPAWIQDADDATMTLAENVFWRTIARHCRERTCVFASDLQNEPVVHWSDSPVWTAGCFDMSDGQKFCYVHRRYRRVQALWTRHIQRQFGSEIKLRLHWPDFPREGESWEAIAPAKFDRADPRFKECFAFQVALQRDWAAGLVNVIRSEDPNHLITVGALDPRPLAGVLDFHCLHLYPDKLPPERRTRAEQRRLWAERVASLPRGKPIIVEEFFPMGGPPGVTFEQLLEDLISSTGPRATGWVSFYWGPPAEMVGNPMGRAIYESWLQIWSRGRTSSQPAG